MTIQTPKILVVDDEPDLELLIRQKFRKEIKEGRYNFEFANNGVNALEKINADNQIELVLTDINMPEMDGLTLLSKIKEMNNPLLHSVIVSAYGDIFNIRTAMNGGAFDFVIKPIDLKDLEITITKALDNLETFKKALRSRDELIAVRKELEEARALQLSMLPESIPQTNDLEIAVYMDTASEVGGDYYDFSIKKDGSLNIAIGDATGHGMKAGIMVSIMKALFISDSVDIDINEFFESSNHTIKSLQLGRMMMAFAMLNYKENQIRFINSGMPPLMIFNNSSKKVEEISINNMPLGAMRSAEYEVKELNVNKGDSILLLSDGLPEMQNVSGEMFGYGRIKELFETNISKSPEEIISILKSEGSHWSNRIDHDDDVTFVIIRIK
ncbi:MAG: stage II sporulation protein E [Ignavibacteriae bacterium]|nr:stage II sporulation protein E [Ignavibacteriota bacterium]